MIMRTRRKWIHMVALMALFLSAMPVAALASPFHGHQCEMACCQPKASKPKPEKKSCCASKMGDTYRSLEESKACRCSIAPAPPQPLPDASIAKALRTVASEISVALPAEPADTPSEIIAFRQAGIFGSDSGPPPLAPVRTNLGRAPPVLLA